MATYNSIGLVNNSNSNAAVDAVLNRLKPYHVKVFNSIDQIILNDMVKVSIIDNLHNTINVSSIHQPQTINLDDGDSIRLNQDMSFAHNLYISNTLRIPPVQVPGNSYYSFKATNSNISFDYDNNEITFKLPKFTTALKLRISININGDMNRYYLQYNTDYRLVGKNRCLVRIPYRIINTTGDSIFSILNVALGQGYPITIDYIAMNSDKLDISLSPNNIDNWIPFNYGIDAINDKSVMGSMGYNKTVYKIKTKNPDFIKGNWLSTQFSPAFDQSFAYTNAEALYGVEPYGYNMYGSTNIVMDGYDVTLIDEAPVADSHVFTLMPNNQLHNYLGNMNEGNYDPSFIRTQCLDYDDANMAYKKFNNPIGYQGGGFTNLHGMPSWLNVTSKYVEADIKLTRYQDTYDFKTFMGSQINVNNFYNISQYNYQLVLDLGYTTLLIGMNITNDVTLHNERFKLNIINGICYVTAEKNDELVGTCKLSKSKGVPMITVGNATNNSITYLMDITTFSVFDNVSIIGNDIVSSANGTVVTNNLSTGEQIYKMYPYYKFKPSTIYQVTNKSDINNIRFKGSVNVNDNIVGMIEYTDVNGIDISYYQEYTVVECTNNVITKTLPLIEKPELIPKYFFVDNSILSASIGDNVIDGIGVTYYNDNDYIIASGSSIVNNDFVCTFGLSNIDNGFIINEIGGFIGNTEKWSSEKYETEIQDAFVIYIGASNPLSISETLLLDFTYYYSYVDSSLTPTTGIDYFNITDDLYGKNRSKVKNIYQKHVQKQLYYETSSFSRLDYNILPNDKLSSFYITYLGNHLYNVATKNNAYGQFMSGIPYESQVDNSPFTLLVMSDGDLRVGDQFIINNVINTHCDKSIEISSGYEFNLSPNMQFMSEYDVKYIKLSIDNTNNIMHISYSSDNINFIQLINSYKITEIIDTDIGYIKALKASNSFRNVDIVYTISVDFSNPIYTSFYKDDKNVMLTFNYFSYDLPDFVRNSPQRMKILPYDYDETIDISLIDNRDGTYKITAKSIESDINFPYNDVNYNYTIGQQIAITKMVDGIEYELFVITIDAQDTSYNISKTFQIKTVPSYFSVTAPAIVILNHAFAMTQSERIGFLNRTQEIGYVVKNIDMFNGGEYYTLEILPSTKIKSIDITTTKKSGDTYAYNLETNNGKVRVSQTNSGSNEICKTGINETLSIYYDDDPSNIINVINNYDIFNY